MNMILPRLQLVPAFPMGLQELNRFSRHHRAYTQLSFAPKVLVDGKVILADLAAKGPPRQETAKWVKRELDRLDPTFIPRCVAKQQASSAARRCGEAQAAPLAGITVGRSRHPLLYDAFFHVVQAEVLKARQQEHLAGGLPIAGVKSGEGVGIQPSDLIDPYTVITGQGVDYDLRAEAALSRLTRSRMELTRVLDAEEVKSKNEEGMEEAQQFAHSEFQVLSDSLLDEVMEQQGIFIPRDADPRSARALAEGITDPYLYSRVVESLDKGDEVSDAQRTYLHRDGTPAFRTKKSAAAGKWKPYEPTPIDAPTHQEATESDSPLAGWSAFDDDARTTSTGTKRKLRLVSQETYDRLQSRLHELQEQADEIAHQLSVALGDGDLSESSAYDEARTAMFQNQKAIADLERELGEIEVGDVTHTNVGQYLQVQIDDHLQTVKLTDADPQIGEVSTISPLGQLLLTAQPGDRFTMTHQVTKRVSGKAVVVSITGHQRVKLERPNGVRVPALPDVITQFALKSKRVKYDKATIQKRVVQVLAIYPQKP